MSRKLTRVVDFDRQMELFESYRLKVLFLVAARMLLSTTLILNIIWLSKYNNQNTTIIKKEAEKIFV